MKKSILIIACLIAVVTYLIQFSLSKPVAETVQHTTDVAAQTAEISNYYTWKRPDGPPKVGIQVGHWKSNELPDELKSIRGNTGASGGGKAEWQVNYDIASRTKSILETQGITVELLPATMPPAYWADAVIAIHADGNTDTSKSGYKMATPWRDSTGKASILLKMLEEEYAKTTSLPLDPLITRNMRGYYAFSWRRYEHAVHQMTPSVIVETGFLSSPSDRKIIVDQPQSSAEGIANALIKFIQTELKL